MLGSLLRTPRADALSQHLLAVEEQVRGKAVGLTPAAAVRFKQRSPSPASLMLLQLHCRVIASADSYPWG
jgi:hypothetical protein